MTRQEFICICKAFISIKIFSKDLQTSFIIKHSSKALRFPPAQHCLKFNTLFWSGKSEKKYPALKPKMLIMYPVLELPLLLKEKLCIVLYCIVLYCIVLHCIVLYCIVLETKTISMLYLLNQMILQFYFGSTMFVQKSFKFLALLSV